MKLIYLDGQLDPVQQQDLQAFIASGATQRCLSDPLGPTQAWVSEQGRLVFKVFDIHRLRHQWRARRRWPCPLHGHRFGWAERLNAQRVQQAGLAAPPVMAFLEQRNPLFCDRQVVVYPYLAEYLTLEQTIAASPEPFEVLDRIEPTLLQLSLQGVFHLDLNSRNLMLGPQAQVKLIDFEYMGWERGQPGLLYAYYLGYLFQKWISRQLDAEVYRAWVGDCLSRRSNLFEDPLELQWTWFDTGVTREASRSERYRMFT